MKNDENIYSYSGEEVKTVPRGSEIADFNPFLRKVFLLMFVGIFATFAVTYGIVYIAPYSVKSFVVETYYFWLIAELVVVLFFSARSRKMSYLGALSAFLIYALISGVTMATLCYIVGTRVFGSVLFFTACYFAALTIFGYATKRDLSSWKSLLGTSLVIIIILSVINLLFYSSTMDAIIVMGGLILFSAFTIYDVNKLKQMYVQLSLENADANTTGKLAVHGALELYLDFINLFIYLLRLVSLSRD